jgi:hypothetical protein
MLRRDRRVTCDSQEVDGGRLRVESDKQRILRMANIAAILKEDLGLDQSYQHGPKRVTPRESARDENAAQVWLRDLYSGGA